MALTKIAEYNPNYKQEVFAGRDIKGYDVYAGTTNDKVGHVEDALVDETGRFRYMVIDTGFWIFGKKVLLPVGRVRIDYDNQNLYALGLTKKQVEALPEYKEDTVVDHDYEERVRKSYRSPEAVTREYRREDYAYEHEPELYETRHEDHGVIRLYEERLVTSKERHKTGDVVVGKRVETETARTSVPVDKEHVVIERRDLHRTEQPASSGEANFQEGEVARMEIYEEKANVHKEAFVTEEVSIRKEIEHETVTAEETLRREELDVDAGNQQVEYRQE